jgi:hypothetical protein
VVCKETEFLDQKWQFSRALFWGQTLSDCSQILHAFFLGPISIVLDPAFFEIRQKIFDRSTLVYNSNFGEDGGFLFIFGQNAEKKQKKFLSPIVWEKVHKGST